jgi:hypothetical protein
MRSAEGLRCGTASPLIRSNLKLPVPLFIKTFPLEKLFQNSRYSSDLKVEMEIINTKNVKSNSNISEKVTFHPTSTISNPAP